MKWDANDIKGLGVLITQNLNRLYEINYNALNNKIQRDLTKWSTQTLDFSSRIEVVQMNLLPRLLYVFLSLPVRIPDSQFASWDKQISRFILAGARPRVKFKTLQIDKGLEGQTLPDFKQYYYAAQMRCIVYQCFPTYQAKWKYIEFNLGEVQPLAKLGEKIIQTKRRIKLF